MHTRQLGPFAVSAIGLGCMSLSHAYGSPPPEAVGSELLLKALDLGQQPESAGPRYVDIQGRIAGLDAAIAACTELNRRYPSFGWAVAQRGRLCVDMSTIDPATSQRVAARLKERGLRFLDAPVSGGVGGAAHALWILPDHGRQMGAAAPRTGGA